MYREGLDVGESIFVVGFYRPGWCSPEKDCFWLCLTFRQPVWKSFSELMLRWSCGSYVYVYITFI